ncbi:hypothetical protein CRENBAI_011327 [Crenichthys baileyi]|uniref:Uncharacterized protein n=1 Tax=Crenichthys baileyi TaxID=28760 RepID=A0AAV9RK85_9TELE
MLDVLIIGGGPHALTLASLLSSPDPGQDSDREDDPLISKSTLSNFDTFKHAPCNERRKRRTTAGGRGVTEHLTQRAGDSERRRSNRMRQMTRKHKAKPTVSESTVCLPLSVLVVDTYGEWVALWESQFTALNIPHLRSHTLVHTDPLNKNALQEFVFKYNRLAELRSLPDHVHILDENAFFNDMRLGKKERRRLNINSTLKKSLSFSLPGTKLSVDFFKEQVRKYKLDKILVKGTVERIIPVTGDTKGIEEEQEAHTLAVSETEKVKDEVKQKVQHFCVELQDGSILKARQVVLATGPTRAQMSNIPEWLKQFDVGDVESLVGRYSHVEHGIKMDGQAYLRQFYNEHSLHKRLAMIRQARKGGAITPEAYIYLQPFIQSGQVQLKTFCQVNEASWCYRSQTWNLSLSTGDHWTGDMIWLATGCKLDVKQDPLLAEVMKNFPIQVVDGWPCILETLQWTEGCPLYLMGQYSALQVGPHAVNLAGGQAAGMRIAKDIIHHHIQDREQDSEMGRGKSRTEEYIQQMQGLFWL